MLTENTNTLKIGIGVVVLKGDQVLLGKRKGSHGEGEWAYPGGHLEYGETFAECARREVREETGLEVKNIRFQYLANSKKFWPKHYTHVNLIADYAGGEPKVLEPERCEEWKWFDLDKPPRPLFQFVELAFRSFRTGEQYFDGQ